MRGDFLPYIFILLISVATFTSYGLAVGFEHVPAFMPFISDAGVLVPERSVFSFFVNAAAFVHMLTIYVVFEQFHGEIRNRFPVKNRHLLRLNKICLLIGLSISFGLSLIANFQLHSHRTSQDPESSLTREKDVIQKIHWLGAFLTYIGGLFWMFIHATLSCFMAKGTKKGQWRRRRVALKFLFALVALIVIISGIVTALTSAMHSDEETGKLEWKDTAKASDKDAKGQLSLTSIMCEWIATFCILAYATTLAPDLRVIYLSRITSITTATDENMANNEGLPKSSENNAQTDPLMMMQLA